MGRYKPGPEGWKHRVQRVLMEATEDNKDARKRCEQKNNTFDRAKSAGRERS